MRVCIDEAWDKDATLEIEDSSSVSCWIDAFPKSNDPFNLAASKEVQKC